MSIRERERERRSLATGKKKQKIEMSLDECQELASIVY